ncbi:MAG: hypothetical protein CMH60_02095 [Myxococcales bacterium]|nr:hypothetical protein [Myxococcales bacterium]
MQRLFSMLAVVSLALFVMNCSGGEKTAKKPPVKSAAKPKAEAQKAAEPAKEEAPAEPAGEPGNIKVTVNFEGTAPKMEPLSRKQDPFCAKTKMNAENVLVNDNNTLRNVVVKLTKGVRGKFDTPAEPAVLDQQACMYRPRVLTMMAGQTLQIKNSDTTLHNVHTYQGEAKKTVFNTAMPPNAKALEKTFSDGNEIITFRCDVHPWMAGFVYVGDHPFHGVTSTDGTVTLSNVPAKKYTLETWHEKYGFQKTEVVVEAGKTAEVTIGYKADQAS